MKRTTQRKRRINVALDRDIADWLLEESKSKNVSVGGLIERAVDSYAQKPRFQKSDTPVAAATADGR